MHDHLEFPALPQAVPAWKMFLITVPSAYVLTVVVSYPVLLWFPGLPFLISTAFVVIPLAAALTFVVIPLSMRLLRRWLYPPQRQEAQDAASPARGEMPALCIETMNIYFPSESSGSGSTQARPALHVPELELESVLATAARLTGASNHLPLAVLKKRQAARLRRFGMP